MPYYLLSIQQPVSEAPPENIEGIMAEVEQVAADLRSSGSWVFGGGLHEPHTATVARPQGDEVLLTDGPYAEGREHVGGLNVIAADDLDAALEWGRKVARATTLPVEVRPFQDWAGV